MKPLTAMHSRSEIAEMDREAEVGARIKRAQKDLAATVKALGETEAKRRVDAAGVALPSRKEVLKMTQTDLLARLEAVLTAMEA